MRKAFFFFFNISKLTRNRRYKESRWWLARGKDKGRCMVGSQSRETLQRKKTQDSGALEMKGKEGTISGRCMFQAGVWRTLGLSAEWGHLCHVGAFNDFPRVHGQVLWKTMERGCSQDFTSSDLSPRSASHPPTPPISSNLAKFHLTVFPSRFSLLSHLCEWETFRGSLAGFDLPSSQNSFSMIPLPHPPHTHCQPPPPTPMPCSS